MNERWEEKKKKKNQREEDIFSVTQILPLFMLLSRNVWLIWRRTFWPPCNMMTSHTQSYSWMQSCSPTHFFHWQIGWLNFHKEIISSQDHGFSLEPQNHSNGRIFFTQRVSDMYLWPLCIAFPLRGNITWQVTHSVMIPETECLPTCILESSVHWHDLPSSCIHMSLSACSVTWRHKYLLYFGYVILSLTLNICFEIISIN